MSRIEVKNVSKNFGETKALHNVSLTLLPNKIYGLLGRNGAGKTTLLNIITNKLLADSGEILVDGETALENNNAQSKIFHMADKNLYPVEMKVKEALFWTKEFYPGFDMTYAGVLLEKFALNPAKKIIKLSTGYNTIFKLILALASGVTVILFDEPVLGLDANHRELFYKELIARCSEQPQIIVVSTHLIAEIANILEEVIIIKNGEIILARPVEEVLQMAHTVSGEAGKVDQYTRGKNVIHEETMGKYKAATVYQKRDSADKEALSRAELEITPAGLQELFINLTNS